MMKSRIREAYKAGNLVLSRRLRAVRVRSTDEFQGHEADHIIYAGCDEPERAFTNLRTRTNILLSRMKISFFYVNKLRTTASYQDLQSPIVRFSRYCMAKERVYKLDKKIFAKLKSFDDVLVANGCRPIHKNRV